MLAQTRHRPAGHITCPRRRAAQCLSRCSCRPWPTWQARRSRLPANMRRHGGACSPATLASSLQRRRVMGLSFLLFGSANDPCEQCLRLLLGSASWLRGASRTLGSGPPDPSAARAACRSAKSRGSSAAAPSPAWHFRRRRSTIGRSSRAYVGAALGTQAAGASCRHAADGLARPLRQMTPRACPIVPQLSSGARAGAGTPQPRTLAGAEMAAKSEEGPIGFMGRNERSRSRVPCGSKKATRAFMNHGPIGGKATTP